MSRGMKFGIGGVCILALLIVCGLVVRNLVRRGDSQQPCAASVSMVRGIVGSEKRTFLTDPDVRTIFRCAGFDLQIDSSGSVDMVQRLEAQPDRYDLAFPASQQTAKRVMEAMKVNESVKPLLSIMGIATFTRTAEMLRAKGVVQGVSGRDVVMIDKLVDLARQGVRWKDLAGDGSDDGRLVLVRTTDPSDSSSAIMFLSIVSAVLNGGKVIAGTDKLAAVMPDLCLLMSAQGTKQSSSGDLYEEYRAGGEKSIPMAMIYESQFYDRVARPQIPADGDHLLLFPNPTIYVRHTLVPRTEAGRAIGKLLSEDPGLRKLAVQHGFRLTDDSPDQRPSPSLAAVVESPDYPVLTAMLSQLGSYDETSRRCVP
ncbi:hypothetical protein [Virgisporangium aurantiacum]|uniref:Extracellular solute-binding protein n=1 Tax=Virgisporangium aurantiacum TaxID=175570 RepID=A0A8J4E7X6_9ACTN|nr:hypothetical protein [Virgisporangium aurantiacum]GIJ64663.1 hypothetical protein Vau01_121790 [Virgisporangium aurantiacum]